MHKIKVYLFPGLLSASDSAALSPVVTQLRVATKPPIVFFSPPLRSVTPSLAGFHQQKSADYQGRNFTAHLKRIEAGEGATRGFRPPVSGRR